GSARSELHAFQRTQRHHQRLPHGPSPRRRTGVGSTQRASAQGRPPGRPASSGSGPHDRVHRHHRDGSPRRHEPGGLTPTAIGPCVLGAMTGHDTQPHGEQGFRRTHRRAPIPWSPDTLRGYRVSGALRTAHPVRNITSNRFDEGRDNAVRISDAARHAAVSPSTVSYVLSGKRSISETTRRRVRRSIEALGYQPHAGARSLASRRTNVIALVVPLREDVHVPVAMRFAVSVVTAARLHDYDVLLLTQGEGPDGLRRVAAGALA